MQRHLKTIQYLRVLCIAEVQKFSSSRRRIIVHNSTNILHDPCLSLLPYPLTHLSCTVARTTYHRQNAHRMSICSFVCFSVHVLLPLYPVSGCVCASVYLQENNPCVWSCTVWCVSKEQRRKFSLKSFWVTGSASFFVHLGFKWGNIPPPIKGALSLFDEPCAVSRLFNFVSRSTLP